MVRSSQLKQGGLIGTVREPTAEGGRERGHGARLPDGTWHMETTNGTLKPPPLVISLHAHKLSCTSSMLLQRHPPGVVFDAERKCRCAALHNVCAVVNERRLQHLSPFPSQILTHAVLLLQVVLMYM